jgi:Ca-activated chloride channel family protein
LTFPRKISFCLFASFLQIASGFQSAGVGQARDAQVSITPRVRVNSLPAGNSILPHADLRVDVPLALIPASVTNRFGTPVTNLNRENFRVFEDGVEQKITYFAQEDTPVSVGLVFDSSASMRNKMRKSWEAASTFLKTANEMDEFFLIEFNERPKLSVAFTRDSGEIFKSISRARSLGRTSLLDAIQLALVQMKHARNPHKAIVILSDGGDNRSRRTAGEIKSALLESDVQLYAMGIFDTGEDKKRTTEELNGPTLLDELAHKTGGTAFPVGNIADLPEISAQIGNELRNQYLLGYAPVNGARDGKYRKVKVSLEPPADMPPLQMHHRQGYYAPSE